MAEHANLSPSAAERWISCPASVQLINSLPSGDVVSYYALEGTKAHALGELEASRAFKKITEKEYLKRYQEWLSMEPILDLGSHTEMVEHVESYVAFIQERVALYPNSLLLLEQRVCTGIEECWGTADAVIVSPAHVEIIDLKYGQGVAVSSYDNPQLRLYGIGALETFADLLGEIDVVRSTIFQPRIGSMSTEELPAEDLRAWRDSIIPVAHEALHEDRPRFGPSEDACRWCPLAGECRARLDKVTREDFTVEAPLLSVEELGEVLKRIPEIKAWCTSVEALALDKAYSGGIAIPGWKVVLSGGKRGVKDEPAAIEALVGNGYAKEDVSVTKLKGIGELETLIKARAPRGTKKDATLESVIGGLVVKGEGKPALVHEGDPRPAIEPNTEAAKEFSND